MQDYYYTVEHPKRCGFSGMYAGSAFELTRISSVMKDRTRRPNLPTLSPLRSKARLAYFHSSTPSRNNTSPPKTTAHSHEMDLCLKTRSFNMGMYTTGKTDI